MARLLGSLSREDFIEKFWDHKALYLKGHPDKFSWLELEPNFHLRFAREVGASGIRVAAVGPKGIQHDISNIDAKPASQFLDLGMTLCIEGVEKYHPPLLGLASTIKQFLGAPGKVSARCYVSPDQGGFGLHFDSQPVFVLQIAGQKRWHYSPIPAMPHPPYNFISQTDVENEAYQRRFPWLKLEVPSLESLAENTLQPGDLLYLPPGSWHQAVSLGFSSSLTVGPERFQFAHLLPQLFDQQLLPTEAWRRSCPLDRVEGPPGQLPPAVHQWIDDNLKLLKKLFTDLSVDDVAALWRREVGNYEFTFPKLPECQTELDEKARIEVPFPITFAEDLSPTGEKVLSVFCANASVEMDPIGRDFLSQLSQRKSFIAEEALNWASSGEPYQWEEIEAALTVLLKVGFLRRSGAS